MHQILIVVQVLVAIGLIGIVLIQQGRGADAGAAFGSGGSGTIFGARGPASALTRITAALAVAFFINSIALAFVAKNESDQMRSVLEGVTPAETGFGSGVPATGADSEPAAPVVSGVPAATNEAPTTEGGVPAAIGDSSAVPAAANDASSEGVPTPAGDAPAQN